MNRRTKEIIFEFTGMCLTKYGSRSQSHADGDVDRLVCEVSGKLFFSLSEARIDQLRGQRAGFGDVDTRHPFARRRHAVDRLLRWVQHEIEPAERKHHAGVVRNQPISGFKAELCVCPPVDRKIATDVGEGGVGDSVGTPRSRCQSTIVGAN